MAIEVRIIVTTSTLNDAEVEVKRREVFGPVENKLELVDALDEARSMVDRAFELPKKEE